SRRQGNYDQPLSRSHRPGAPACRTLHRSSIGGSREDAMGYRGSICAVTLVTTLLAAPCAAQMVDPAKYPNFKGQWIRPPGIRNNWVRLAGAPPLTPEYQKIWEESQADIKAGGPGNWPSTFCIPAGMPAMMSFYDPGEIIVTPETTYILISHNDDSYRR